MSPHRTRDWRRAQARKHPPTTYRPVYDCTRAKDWKLIYQRRPKLYRAKKLGKIWPYREWEALMADAQPLNILFICSKNQWRSPTGETLYRKVAGVNARSAGTARSARRTVSIGDIRWSDLILVMENKHLSRLRADFRDEVRYKPVHVLDIPDDYPYMDAELVELLRAKTDALIEAHEA